MSFSIVIPSRSESNLRACIGAIRDAGETCRIIVVWDGDIPEDGRKPLDESPSSLYAPLLQVVGIKPFNFSRNCNIGIVAAGDDDCLLLNDDALLRTSKGFSALEVAAHYVEIGPEGIQRKPYGAVAAACNGVGNVNQHQQIGTLLRVEPRMLCFTCVYIPRSTINRVGLLDPRFTSYGFEDDDYCLRVRQAGLKLGIYDGCFVDHESLPSEFRKQGGPGADLSEGDRIFREKWGKGNHEL